MVSQSRAEKWQNKADEISEMINCSVEKPAESDIIKSIDIDDLEIVTLSSKVSEELIEFYEKCYVKQLNKYEK